MHEVIFWQWAKGRVATVALNAGYTFVVLGMLGVIFGPVFGYYLHYPLATGFWVAVGIGLTGYALMIIAGILSVITHFRNRPRPVTTPDN